MRKFTLVFSSSILVAVVLNVIIGTSRIGAQAQAGNARLVWKPLPNFKNLVPGIDYATNEVLAIIKPVNLKRVLDPNGKLAIALAQKGFILSEHIQIPARFNDPLGHSSQVCGQILLRFSVPGSTSIQDAINNINNLSGNDEIYGVAPNGFGLPNQIQLAQDSWPLEPIAVPTPTRNQGQGVRVAVLDTGVSNISAISTTNPKNYVDVGGITNLVDDDFNPTTANQKIGSQGHGTGVAGVIGGADSGLQHIGVAPLAKIVPIKVCDTTGHCRDSSVVMGMCYAVSKSSREKPPTAIAQVLNVSLGGFINSPILEGAIRDAGLANALVVASAGNTREFEQDDPHYNLPVFPAAFSNDTSVNLTNLMSIGAIDINNTYTKFATVHRSVDMVAPGVNIRTYSRYGMDYTGAEGTSYAAGFVSGAAALMFSKVPSLKPAKAKIILKTFANQPGCIPVQQGGPCGFGLLDVTKALENTP